MAVNSTDYYRLRIENNQIHSLITNLRARLAEVDQSPNPAELFPRVDRMRKIVDRFELSLRMADPLMVPQSSLQGAVNAVNAATTSLTNYQSSKSEGYLDNANNELDVFLSLLPAIEKRPAMKTVEASAKILAGVRRTVEDDLSGIKKTIQDVVTELSVADRKANDIREEVDRKSQSFSAEMQRFSQRYEEEEEQRRKSARELIDRVDGDSQKAVAGQKAALELVEAQATRRLNELTTELQADGHAVIEALEKDKESAQKLLGIVGETGLIAGYQKEANSKRTEARIWRIMAFVAFGVTAYVGYTLLTPPATGKVELNWEGLLARTVLLALLGLVAAYAAKEASNASRSEETNRRNELQLASVGPFIAELADEKRQEIKEKYVDRMYVPVITEGRVDTDKTVATVGQLVLNLLKEVPSIMKAGRPS